MQDSTFSRIAELMGSMNSMTNQLQQYTTASNTFTGPTEPAFYGQVPDTVKVMDRLPIKGGSIKEITRQQFEQQEGIIWSSSPYVYQQQKRNWLSPTGGMGKGAYVNLVAFHMYYNDRDMIICDMDPSVGKGLIANRDYYMGEKIDFYPGLLRSCMQEPTTFSPYRYDMQRPELQRLWFIKHYGNVFFDAQAHRNHLAYAQHALPGEHPHLKNVPEQLRQKVSTCNMNVVPTFHMTFPMLVFVAGRDIKKGEFLQYDYGQYWQSQYDCSQGDGRFALFDSAGRIMGMMSHDGQYEPAPDYDSNGVPDAPRCSGNIEELIKKQEKNRIIYTGACGDYFRENVKGTIANARNWLDAKYITLLDEFDAILHEEDLVHLNDALIGKISAHEFDQNPDLEHFKRELILYNNFFSKDYKRLQERQRNLSVTVKPSLDSFTVKNVTRAELIELKCRLKQITDYNWKASEQKQKVFLVGPEEQLIAIKKHFGEHNIDEEQFYKTKGGYCLSYCCRELNLRSLGLVKDIVCSGNANRY